MRTLKEMAFQSQNSPVSFIFFSLLSALFASYLCALRIEPRAMWMLCTWFTTEPSPPGKVILLLLLLMLLLLGEVCRQEGKKEKRMKICFCRRFCFAQCILSLKSKLFSRYPHTKQRSVIRLYFCLLSSYLLLWLSLTPKLRYPWKPRMFSGWVNEEKVGRWIKKVTMETWAETSHNLCT